MSKRFAIRVDIDTVRGLVDGIPHMLEICEKLGVKATFFTSVGTDTATRAFLHSPKPGRHLAISPLKKYGIKEIVGSLKGRDFSSHSEEIRHIEKCGHEVQLHCFDHVEWVRKIDEATVSEAAEMIARGVETFERMMGRKPEGFASPAFRVTEAVHDAEESIGFRYASDYTQKGDCIPFTQAGRSVLQIPVNAPLIEDLVVDGVPDDRIVSRMVDMIEGNSLTVVYLHACYEPRIKHLVLSSIIERALDVAEDVTFKEVWQAWSQSN